MRLVSFLSRRLALNENGGPSSAYRATLWLTMLDVLTDTWTKLINEKYKKTKRINRLTGLKTKWRKTTNEIILIPIWIRVNKSVITKTRSGWNKTLGYLPEREQQIRRYDKKKTKEEEEEEGRSGEGNKKAIYRIVSRECFADGGRWGMGGGGARVY